MKSLTLLRRRWGVGLACGIIALSGRTLAGNFSYYGVGKGLCYDQTKGGQPILKEALPWAFEAQLIPNSRNIFNARVSRDTNAFSPPIIILNTFTPGYPSLDARRATTQVALDASYTNGSFYFKIESINEGTVWVNVDLAAGVTLPAPTVTNLAAAQSVDSTTEFTLEWEPFSGGTANDFIYCEIRPAFRSGFVPGGPTALNGTNCSITIPAGTLISGKVYLGRLVFARVQSIFTNAYPGASGAAYLFSQTEFWLRTQGNGDTNPPVVVWSNPHSGATDVPKDMPITIEFSKPMSSSSSVFATGFLANPTWSSNRTIVYFPAAGSGGSTSVRNLLLNPYDNGGGFRDLNGNDLAETGITFTTSPDDMVPSPAMLSNYQRNMAGSFETEVRGMHGARYALQNTSDFISWFDIATNPAVGGVTHFMDTDAANAPFRIYRAVER